jgi:hypothetical protein
MKTKRMIATVWCLALFAVASGNADYAGAEPFRYTISGAGYPTPIDTNGDGETAGILNGEGMSTLGPISVQLLNEFVLDQDPQNPEDPVICALPDGTPGIQLRQILGTPVFQVRRMHLVYAELVEGTACLSLLTCFDVEGNLQPGCRLSGPRRFEITGGTGPFTGASGFIDVESNFEVLVVSPTGLFSAGVDVAEGEIHVPQR